MTSRCDEKYHRCDWLHQMCLHETYLIILNGRTTTKYNQNLERIFIPNTNGWDMR